MHTAKARPNTHWLEAGAHLVFYNWFSPQSWCISIKVCVSLSPTLSNTTYIKNKPKIQLAKNMFYSFLISYIFIGTCCQYYGRACFSNKVCQKCLQKEEKVMVYYLFICKTMNLGFLHQQQGIAPQL